MLFGESGGLALKASQNIPIIADPWVSDRARKTLDKVRLTFSTACHFERIADLAIAQIERFVEEVCIPADTAYAAQLGTGDERWIGHPSIMEDLKDEARKRGLFNMFLPKNHFKEGAGFSNVEYGVMAEQLGKSRTASEVCRTAMASIYVQSTFGNR